MSIMLSNFNCKNKTLKNQNMTYFDINKLLNLHLFLMKVTNFNHIYNKITTQFNNHNKFVENINGIASKQKSHKKVVTV